MELGTNNFEGWQKIYKKLIDGKERIITVEVNTADMDLGSLTNLRYFFPLASYLLGAKKISNENPLKIDIQLPENSNEDDRRRLTTFFSQVHNISEVKITVNGSKLQVIKWQASRIFPLCWVQGKDAISAGIDYSVLNECMYDDGNKLNKTNDDKNIYAELANALLSYIRDQRRYIGTPKYKLNPDKKKTLLDEIESYLNKHLPHMSILAQIIWLYILRELIEMKDLFNFSKTTDEHPHIHKDIMEKSRLDAVSYGESMYQLIENACVHSSGHKAWFGFRMHRAGKNVTMSNLAKEVQTRNRLYDDYRQCFSNYDNDEPFASDDNIFNKDYRYFFEFFVLDDAAKQQSGMVIHYNQRIADNNDSSRKPINELEDLFNIPVRENPLKVHVADVTVHYGLRLLRKMVSINDGYLVGKTPNDSGETQCYFDGNPVKESMKHVHSDSFVTEWKAIIPIEYKWPELTMNSEMVNEQNCFGRKIEQPRKKLRFLSREELFKGLSDYAKDEDIAALRGNLKGCMSALKKNELENSVILIGADKNNIYSLEIFSKALFAEIAEINGQKDSAISLRIAIIFEHLDAIYEFVRLFSVFYPNGIQPDMKNVQIALCTKNSMCGDVYDAVVMLAGSHLSNTYEYARLFAYHHSENALEYLPLLDYLTMKGNKNANNTKVPKEDIALFPFELWLPTKFQSGTNELSDWQHNWFLARMRHILCTNIQDKSYGCMIDDIHIRLGSKIHLNRFFEAELLFQNMGNVVRFAYMIAHELLYGKQQLIKDQPVLLLGYEKYSSMLILQVEYWINQSGLLREVNTAIVYDDEDEREVSVHPFFNAIETASGKYSNVQIVTVLPVGTTLSTIYKMQNVSKEYLGKYFGIQWSDKTNNTNFCLILVNKIPDKDSALNAVSERYWLKAERDTQLITVNRESTNGQDIQVKYFLDADAEWTDPLECPVCKTIGRNIRPIIDGKHSDTMPGAIFSLWGSHAGTFKKLVGDKAKNMERISALFGNVVYSHLYYGNNHFQFYIDFKKLYEENKTAIDKDLRERHVEQDRFHVVVSPMQLKNSTFIKAVIDNAFDGNARFLHINLADAYREEVRAKFSHLTEEFRRMRIVNPKAKFAFHFVDTSVVMGNQLNRSRLLIKMLLNQSNVDYDDVQLFDRVFLLVNRCSYDTANYLVREPEDHLYAYIHLAIPSYNTENDLCPACKLTTKFQLLGKRSSTERLSREFLRLQEKHKKRTREEYQYWLEGSTKFPGSTSTEHIQEQDRVLLKSPAYLGWLKQWLFVNVFTDKKKILSFVPKEAEARKNKQGTVVTDENLAVMKLKKGIEEYAEKSGDWNSSKIKWGQKIDDSQSNERDIYLEKLTKTNLYDVAKFISDEEERDNFLASAQYIIKTHLIGVRDYMRLKAMQQSYEELEISEFEKNSMRDGNHRKVIINLIGNAIAEPNIELKSHIRGLNRKEQARFVLVHNVEWLISYIKVLSRAQLVNYYEYRQAITGIMSDMLRILSEKKIYENYFKELPNEDTGKDEVDKNWKAIVILLGTIREYDKPVVERQLCAKLCYQVYMTLVHRMADLQISSRFDADSVLSTLKLYSELLDCYFSSKPSGDVPYIDLPPSSKIIIRYLKSAKAATMTSNDDAPCLVLADISNNLKHESSTENRSGNASMEKNLLCTAQYIYLENTRMLFSGMSDMKKLISADVLKEIATHRPAESFEIYMDQLNKEVNRCLSSCYKNPDIGTKEKNILYQNLLANFCRFWYESTKEEPIGHGDGINPIAYMLFYFMSLENLSDEMEKKQNNSDLPYLYEELCHILCGITGFQMCYFTYYHAGNYPEIFAQSGYYVNLMKKDKILTPELMDVIVRFSKDKEKELISGITRITQFEGCDYLVLFIPMIGDIQSSDGFYIVFQSEEQEKIPGADKSELDWTALRKARDVLFLRQRLQGVLSRDYNALVNYRYDCSYVRPISKDNEGHPSAIHISDLHIQQDMSAQSKDICNQIKRALKNCGTKENPAKIDLLIISGDIVDSREANAPKIEQNYRYAERLLNHIVSTLWMDKREYLPHDWRHRIIVTPGNHDYASMNQYQAALRGRALTSAMPTDGESGTMSKFAYFIEFLIHYLDAPVDQLLYNDLNEVRFYKKLNLKVLALNCSGSATPRRTNKMGINDKKVKELLERDVWKSNEEKIYNEKGKVCKSEPFRLVIGHYSPQYELSYFLDNYDVLPGWEWKLKESGKDSQPINHLVKLFQIAVQDELPYRFEKEKNKDSKYKSAIQNSRKNFMDAFDGLKDAISALENGKGDASYSEGDPFFLRLNEFAKNMVSKGLYKREKDIVGKMKENELYQLIEKYYNWLKLESEVWSEDISKLLHEVGESICMGEQDKELFKNFVDREIKDKDLYLAGHIHAYAEDGDILVADKLFETGRTEIHGYIIQNLVKVPGDGKVAYHYERFQ